MIWIASYPRSGNTFFRLLLHELYGIQTYSIYDDPLLDTLGASETLGHAKLPEGGIEALRRREEPAFVKTHKFSSSKPRPSAPMIFLIRDGRDAMVSYANYRREFSEPRYSFRITLKRLIQAPVWSTMVTTWFQRNQSIPGALVRYEELVQNSVEVVQRAVQVVAPTLVMTGQKELDFTELHTRWPTFFRKGQVGSWKEDMPKDLLEPFWRKHGRAMRMAGYGDTPN